MTDTMTSQNNDLSSRDILYSIDIINEYGAVDGMRIGRGEYPTYCHFSTTLFTRLYTSED
jgi:hypothetical protein